MYDFLRFLPENLSDLGFKSYVFMLEKPGGCGIVIKADSPRELRKEIMVIKKFDVPFIVTTAAENQWELRTRKQVESFFKFFGAEIPKARNYAERLVRRYFDDRYIMDGFEIDSFS